MIVKRAVVLMLALLLAYLTWTAVHIDRFDWDLAITQWMQSIPHESLDPLPRLISRMGVLGVAGILGILAILLFWLRGWRTEAAFVAMIGLVDLLNPLFRYAIGRPRPDPLNPARAGD